MPASFLSLPGEIRNQIYELTLLLEEPKSFGGYQWPQDVSTGLLVLNKNVHRETSLFFYSRNIFDFTYSQPWVVASFFKQIGSRNAGHIQHIKVDFPEATFSSRDEFTLEEKTVEILETVRDNCTGLRTLETSETSPVFLDMEWAANNEKEPEIAIRVLKLIDTHFRAIQPIQEIIINVYAPDSIGYPSDSTDSFINKMKDFGWTISIREEEEEDEDAWVNSGCEYMGDDFDDYDDYGDYEEYDIDNDSDFDRRALD